ncbi:L-ascorbate metabolism protein UlaG (beta-lactamase superfamily) [Mumia flava]|uniref:L-ascorbate metabolism protein UlaG (Beta-lactamase superfamily) n=1 Tax=Mumia flava TaxID=1348852 RepID=A0A0B2B8I6_9ACTN|nr:MBL fold metallo-hydrolase [Mumia flava]PJJ53469.1 L-ascorbate metabolism protein UlaG (beta-lactamase superfamily) [Mumia flava]
MRITRFGHAALLVETDRTRVLIDPGTFSLDAAFDLTDLDAVVVTHQHPDHVDPTRVGRLVGANSSARLLAEPQTVASLRGFGVWEATAAEVTYEVGDVTLTGVGFLHAVIHPDIPTIGNVGVLVEHDGTRLLHPGDSYASAPLEVDALAVPLSAPWAKVSETVDFVRAVSPRVVFPIHDSLLTESAHAMYWARVSEMSGVADARAVAADGSLEV